MDNYEDIFGDLFANFFSIANGWEPDHVGREYIDHYVINTTETVRGNYETSIWKDDGNAIIVQRYTTRAAAESGHKIWSAIAAAHPLMAWDIQTNEYKSFDI